ncbi:hypothetical protein EC991_004374 [Linnemannia zychae]|nr:hypothetical protein EC991_004374 [Linnemannia zychae]
MKYSSKATLIVVLATAVALCSTTPFLSSAHASPVGQVISQQSTFNPTSFSGKQAPLCGTVIAIDFGEEKFSVGYINPITQHLDLFPNNYNETTTPSYVRIVNHLDGSQETTVGKDALYRPFDEHEKAAIAAKEEKILQWNKGHRRVNFTLPVPEHNYEFRPDEAYGLGLPESIVLGESDMRGFFGRSSRVSWSMQSTRSLRSSSKEWYYDTEMSGLGGWYGIESSFNEEWDDGIPKRASSSFDNFDMPMGQCIRTAEEMDWRAEERRMRYERRQKVAGILMEKARKMSEAELEAKVKYAVVTMPSFTIAKRYQQPESTIDAATRAGLEVVRVLDQAEAAVFAYEPVLAEAERAAKGQPQTVVMYYLNDDTEGLSVFETFRVEGEEEFLQLKLKAKYHFFQSVDGRMKQLLGRHLYSKYQQGLYFTTNKPRTKDSLNPDKQPLPLEDYTALHRLSQFVERYGWEIWPADSGDVEEKFYLSDWEYVLLSHREWWEFERAFLKKHFLGMLERAYERSGVAVEERKKKGEVDFFLVVDESRFQNSTSAIMKEALGGKVRELVDAVVDPKTAITHGAARVAEYLTKLSARDPCK